MAVPAQHPRVRIDYFDQNDGFKPLLPRIGHLVGRYSDIHGNSDWYLVRLKDPISYQLKLSEHYQFRLVEALHVLVKSRLVGKSVGEAEPTSAFMLLVEESQLPLPSPINPADYVHAAWVTCTTFSDV
jgi:hypothetical protein